MFLIVLILCSPQTDNHRSMPICSSQGGQTNIDSVQNPDTALFGEELEIMASIEAIFKESKTTADQVEIYEEIWPRSESACTGKLIEIETVYGKVSMLPFEETLEDNDISSESLHIPWQLCDIH